MRSNRLSCLRGGSALRHLLSIGLATIACSLIHGAALGQGVFSSPHNLSVSGGRGEHGVSFSEETRVCVFCHVPHNARQPQLLWSRDLPSEMIYTPYASTTLKATPAPGLPTGASRLCLSCHDGTIALGQFASSRVSGSSEIPPDPLPARNANLTTVLSDDHPISFSYTEALAAQAELVAPGALPPSVGLDLNGELQCTACHNPHNNQFDNFMVVNNRLPGSPLCTACHNRNGWYATAHNPQQTPAMTSGCMNCHYSHSAPAPMRLLHSPSEEDNCFLNCHNGSGSATGSPDIRTTFESNLYRHPVDMTTGIHDPAEVLPATVFHVECADCHNPHQTAAAEIPLPAPPVIHGPLKGVRIDAAGTVAENEYEICFKCHAGSHAANFRGFTAPMPRRLLDESDQQIRFDGANPSYHPVTTNRRGNGASLKLGLQTGMVRIYCSECHNNDRSRRAGGSGGNGPHGSIYPHILIAQYEMPTPADPKFSYSSSIYALCFRCHEETFVMGIGSAFLQGNRNQHDDHVRVRNIPCFVCHDPHGTSLVAGATATGNAHLINFDLDYTTSSAVPNPQYQTFVPASGTCIVACHSNATHSYP